MRDRGTETERCGREGEGDGASGEGGEGEVRDGERGRGEKGERGWRKGEGEGREKNYVRWKQCHALYVG